jgi:hypothetical protein
MKRTTSAVPRCLLVLAVVSLVLSSMSWGADNDKDQSTIAKRIDASAQVLNEIMATPDKTR